MKTPLKRRATTKKEDNLGPYRPTPSRDREHYTAAELSRALADEHYVKENDIVMITDENSPMGLRRVTDVRLTVDPNNRQQRVVLLS